MSFKEKKLSDRLKSQEQHTMENYLKPFVSLPGGSHSWSPHRFHAHKWTWHCRGITARMWQRRPHLESNPLRFGLLERGISISTLIHLAFPHSLISKPEPSFSFCSQTKTYEAISSLSLLLLMFNRDRMSPGSKKREKTSQIETKLNISAKDQTEMRNRVCCVHRMSVFIITLQFEVKMLQERSASH